MFYMIGFLFSGHLIVQTANKTTKMGNGQSGNSDLAESSDFSSRQVELDLQSTSLYSAEDLAVTMVMTTEEGHSKQRKQLISVTS